MAVDMIDWLYGLQHFGIKLGLDNIRGLLRLLGHPQRAYPSVLIAGTNGKGSVAAMLHAMLNASGRKAGMFTSPHLIHPAERIRIGREEITPEELTRLLRKMKEIIEPAVARGQLEAHPSFFEVITATALEAFRERGAEVAVLEVGLGGRLDATNAVDAALAIIVSIDLDHVKSLGPTVEKIAWEKAGIIKQGRPLVSGAVRQRAVSVLRRIAQQRDAEWIDARLAVSFEAERNGKVTLQSARARYEELQIGLPGRHQIDNARVALAALERIAPDLGLDVDPAAVRAALRAVRWPARLQWIRGNGNFPDLLIDGAHNPAGVETLAGYLRSLGQPPPVLLFGAMHGKLLPQMLAMLAPLADSIVLTRPDVRRAAEPDEVAELARRHLDRVEVVREPARALERAAALAGSERYVLVAGSLYLAGAILASLAEGRAPGAVSM
jgi:dihydrofolate synthase/folylpolyglutamate synthase